MTLTNKVWTQLETDSQLRLKVALALKVQEQSVIGSINRRSDVLTKIAALKAIQEHTGLTIEEVIEENETVSTTTK
jgi:hypothetical protein